MMNPPPCPPFIFGASNYSIAVEAIEKREASQKSDLHVDRCCANCSVKRKHPACIVDEYRLSEEDQKKYCCFVWQPDQMDKTIEMVQRLANSVEGLSNALADHMANMDREFGQMWNYILSRK